MRARMCEAVQLQLKLGVNTLPSCGPSANAHSTHERPRYILESCRTPKDITGSASRLPLAVAVAWRLYPRTVLIELQFIPMRTSRSVGALQYMRETLV